MFPIIIIAALSVADVPPQQKSRWQDDPSVLKFSSRIAKNTNWVQQWAKKLLLGPGGQVTNTPFSVVEMSKLTPQKEQSVFVFCKLGTRRTAKLNGATVQILSESSSGRTVSVRSGDGQQTSVEIQQLIDRTGPTKTWIPVYIGHGDLARIDSDAQLCQSLFEKGATHVHLHVHEWATERIAEAKDLLAQYPIAYAPEGCNLR